MAHACHRYAYIYDASQQANAQGNVITLKQHSTRLLVIFSMSVLTMDNSAGLPHDLICHVTLATVAVWVVNLSNSN